MCRLIQIFSPLWIALLVFGFCKLIRADIDVQDLKTFQPEKINEVFVGVLNEYIKTLKELDECIDICEVLLEQTGNDMRRIMSLNDEILHYKRCKWVLMMVMVKAHPMCMLGDFEQFKQFALEAFEVADSLGRI